MEGQLYIRVRGRVLGPYEREKLREQVRRGQLSRMHEVSEDGVTWTRASSYADLFQSSPAEATNGANVAARPNSPLPQSPAAQSPVMQQAMHVAAPVAQMAVPMGLAAPGGIPLAGGPAWYYTRGDQEYGPVEFAQLQQAVNLGTVTADDQVWTDGMADWTSPTQVRGLSVRKLPTTKSGSEVAVREESGDVSSGVVRSMASSRGWVLFIAICMFLCALPTGFWGLFLLISGAGHAAGAGVVFAGLITVVEGLVFATAGFLLSMYYSRMGEVMATRKTKHLERALGALNSYWIFLSSLLIVGILSVLVLLTLLLFAVASVESLRRPYGGTNFSSPNE